LSLSPSDRRFMVVPCRFLPCTTLPLVLSWFFLPPFRFGFFCPAVKTPVVDSPFSLFGFVCRIFLLPFPFLSPDSSANCMSFFYTSPPGLLFFLPPFLFSIFKREQDLFLLPVLVVSSSGSLYFLLFAPPFPGSPLYS